MMEATLTILFVFSISFAGMLWASADFKLTVADKLLQLAIWAYWELRARAMAQEAAQKEYRRVYGLQKRAGREPGAEVNFDALRKFGAEGVVE